MANDQIQLYNFYRRYKWTEDDFRGWQTGMVEHSRGMFEGLLKGSVLFGFDVAPSGSGLAFTVSEGLASSATGYLMVNNVTQEMAVEAPVSEPRRDLLVVRPLLEDNLYITKPTNPFELVPLRTAQKCALYVIQGVEANSPIYPDKEENDIILCGVRVAPGQTSLTEPDFDLEVREIIGKNSLIQQNAAKYDDRLLPYRFNNNTLAIKPSQLFGSKPRAFSYVSSTLPSIFPKNALGEFNPLDTFLNFNNGEITGGDEISTDFATMFPTAGNFIVASVALNNSDNLVVSYGIEGTREQCYSGIINTKTAGAGSISVPNNAKLIAFVVLASENGVSISELDYIDCRAPISVAGGGSGGSGFAGAGVGIPVLPLNLSTADDNKVLLIDTSAASGVGLINLPAAVQNLKFTVKDIGGMFGTNPVEVVPNGVQEIDGLNENYPLDADFGSWNFICDGTNWSII